ncbi:hypothetical protein CBR_g8099 [Chara braunii]|uniref:Protein kinase domain-containing protein n=1 Tax=Chara braunii TaxID=69332 RepID=A0A388KL60_CHABU|nr:hypothetical protein CBR_g8099 [Chara braunii]|eukprot:GBG70799.1 hypothetical protein CBR_g8099 [Chara braunii]
MAAFASSRVIRRFLFALLQLAITSSLPSSLSQQPVRLPRGMAHLSVRPAPSRAPVDSECHLSGHRKRRKLETFTEIRILEPNVLTLRAQYADNISATEQPMYNGSLALALSPQDQSLFILLANGVWRMSTNQTTNRSTASATLFARPIPSAGNLSRFLQAMALEEGDLEGTGTTAGAVASGDTWRARILHVAEGGDTIRALSIKSNGSSMTHQQLGFLNYTGVTGSRPIESMTIDSQRRILYASTGRAIYRANLTYTPGGGGGGGGGGAGGEGYSALEHWLGAKESNSGGTDNPRDVLFGHAILDESAISPDGEKVYFVDRDYNMIRRLWTRTGAVDRIAGGLEARQDGPPSQAAFRAPQALAVTHDGCHVFVLEQAIISPRFGEDNRLSMIRLSSSWGKAVNVTTIANMYYGYLYKAMALSPESDTLYLFRGGDVVELGINRSALGPCGGGPASPRAKRPVSPSPENNTRVIVMASAGVVLLLVALSVLIAIVVIRRRRGPFKYRRKSSLRESPIVADSSKETKGSGSTWASATSAWSEDSSGIGAAVVKRLSFILRPTSGLKRYSLEEISRACEQFSPERVVGTGGAAEVYKGVLSDGQVVAIKMMKDADFLEAARFRQFQAELDVLGSLRHSQICSIVGYCAEKGKSFLIYPFVEGGTLHERLRSAGRGNREQDVVPTTDSISDGSVCARRKPPLDWKTRLSIAGQIASALQYLHEQVDPPIVHRDVKTKNVLLEDHGEGDWTSIRAYLSDFGLAKVGQSVFGAQPAAETVDTYHVAGTFGYMAPEYYSSCRLTAKNDVYAFGVVLLELITGRQAFMSSPRRQRQGKQEEEKEEEAREGNEGDMKSTEPVEAEAEGEEEEEEEEEEEWESGPRTLAYWAKRKLHGEEVISSEDDEYDDEKPLRTSAARVTVVRRTTMEAAVHTERIREIADGRLATLGPVDWTSVCGVMDLAVECIRTSPRRRPQMGFVVDRLGRIEESMRSREQETR